MKKPTWIAWLLLTIIVIIFCGVVFHAPLSVGFGSLVPAIALGIKAWKEVLMVLGALLLIAEVTRRREWRLMVHDRVLQLCLAYGVIHILCMIVMPLEHSQIIAGLMIDLRYIVFFVLVYGALRLYPAWRTPLLVGGAGAAVVSLTFVLLQVTVLPHDILKYIGYEKNQTIAPYLTVDQNYDYVRVNGTLRGPNPLGAYAMIVLALLIAAWTSGAERFRFRTWSWRQGALVLLAIGGIAAVWFSYSRSALLALGIAAALAGSVYVGRRLSRKMLFVLGAVVLGGGILLAALWQTSFIQQVVLHKDPDGGSSVSSNEQHAESLTDGFERMIAQPYGAGVGSTGSASLSSDTPLIIESQFFFIAHESGWIGLGIFCALLGMILYRLWRQRDDWVSLGVCASGIALISIAVLHPIFVDDTVSIVWWGLAAIALAAYPKVTSTSKKRYTGTQKRAKEGHDDTSSKQAAAKTSRIHR